VEQADIAQETSFQKGDSLGIYPWGLHINDGVGGQEEPFSLRARLSGWGSRDIIVILLSKPVYSILPPVSSSLISFQFVNLNAMWIMWEAQALT
jgi:hypothetical protein